MKIFRRTFAALFALWSVAYVNAHLRVIWTPDAIYFTRALAQSCNDPSGFLKTFGPMKIGDLLSLGPDCQHASTGSAAGSVPATNVFYTIPLAGGVSQSQTNYNFRSIVNVTDFGAVGDGVTDDAPAFRAASDAIANGGALHIPTTTAYYRMNSCRNGAVLETAGSNANKSVSLVGDGWSAKTGGSLGQPRGSILRLGIGVADTCDFASWTPTDQIAGLAWRNFYLGNEGTPVGRHGFFMNGANAAGYVTDLIIDHVFIDNMKTGYSIKSTAANSAPFSGAIAFSKISNNALMSFNADFLGDEVTIEHNRFGQNATNDARDIGIQFENVSGATSTLIFHNVMSNFNQMISVRGGTKTIIRDNEFELGSSFSNAAMVDLSGSTNLVSATTITGNSFSQNVSGAQIAPLRVANASGSQIYDNRITEAPNTPYDYVSVTGAASATFIGYNRCEWNSAVSVTVDPQCMLSTVGPAGFQYKPGGFVFSGSSSGSMTLAVPNAALASILNFPAITGSDTFALLGAAQTFTNKTLTASSVTGGISIAGGVSVTSGNITAPFGGNGVFAMGASATSGTLTSMILDGGSAAGSFFNFRSGNTAYLYIGNALALNGGGVDAVFQSQAGDGMHFQTGGSNTDRLAITAAGVIQANGVSAVSCAAGVVVLATVVVTNGIVTHC